MAFYFFVALALVATCHAQAPAVPASAESLDRSAVGVGVARSPVCVTRNGYYKVDANCDSYVECSEFVATDMVCPDGLHFNPDAKWPAYPCGYPQDVVCRGRGVVQPAQPTDDCPHQYGYFPSPGNCGQYRMCVAGRASEMSCSTGLIFNPDTGRCDWPDVAPPCKAEEPAQPTADCPHQYGYFASPAATPDNCGQYRMCVAGRAIEMICPTGLAFNPDSGRCDWPDLVASCKAEEFLGFSCPAAPLDVHGQPLDIIINYKYEGNCYYFFACEQGRARLLSCDVGLAFDPALGRCVDADLVQCK